MLNKLKHWLFTFNLTFLLVLNLFLIIVAVLGVTAAVVWTASGLGAVDWTRLLTPSAVSILIYALSILIGISMVVMIQKVILQPVRGMVDAMQRLAGGDFSVRMTCKGWMRPLELRAFTQAFNTAAEELGSTEILRKDFINNFSHEFRTPIMSILGFAGLLKKEDLSEDRKKEYLDIIISECRRLSELSDNVLNLSKVESLTLLTDTEEFNAGEQVRESILMLEQKWNKKKCVLT